MSPLKTLVNALRIFKFGSVETKPPDDTPQDSSPRRVRNFREYLVNLADDLPWFGEEPFTAAPEPTPPRPVHGSPPYVRRILLAFLAGRPVAVAAGRAGCSPRTMYSVINRVIYEPQPRKLHDLWFYLGLIAIVDYDYDEERPKPGRRLWGTLERKVEEHDALMFCLVCHRFLMPVKPQRSTIPQMLEEEALFLQRRNASELVSNDLCWDHSVFSHGTVI
jgi:hypothetical protein